MVPSSWFIPRYFIEHECAGGGFYEQFFCFSQQEFYSRLGRPVTIFSTLIGKCQYTVESLNSVLGASMLVHWLNRGVFPGGRNY